MKNILKKGFTLIELLIVIGILGILVATTLIALNPAEAQRKGRDAQRLSDLKNLQIYVESYLNNGNQPIDIPTVTSSTGTVNAGSNWLTLDLTGIATKVPIDPINNLNSNTIAGTDETTCKTATKTARTATVYRFNMRASGDYEIDATLESTANCDKINKDGGNSPKRYEVFNNVATYLPDN